MASSNKVKNFGSNCFYESFGRTNGECSYNNRTQQNTPKRSLEQDLEEDINKRNQTSQQILFVKSPRTQLFSPNTNISDERGEQVDTVDQLPDSRGYGSLRYKDFQGGYGSKHQPNGQSTPMEKQKESSSL